MLVSHRRILPFLFVAILLASTVGPLAAADALTKARQGNRASLDAIRTFFTRFEINLTPDGPTAPNLATDAGEYWKEADLVRVRWRYRLEPVKAWETTDAVFTRTSKKAFSSRVFDKNKPDVPGEVAQPGTYGMVTAVEQPHSGGDVWSLTLCKIPGDYLPLDEFFEKKFDSLRASEVTSKDGVVYQIEAKRGKQKWEITVDPAVNNLIRKLIFTVDKLNVQTEVLRFREVEQGMFFPELAEERYVFDGKQHYVSHTTLSGTKVNAPMEPSVFAIRFPPGVPVEDHIEGLRYVVGADGKPDAITKVIKLEFGPTRMPTLTEERSITPIVMLAVFVPMTLVATFLAVRQRRRG